MQFLLPIDNGFSFYVVRVKFCDFITPKVFDKVTKDWNPTFREYRVNGVTHITVTGSDVMV